MVGIIEDGVPLTFDRFTHCLHRLKPAVRQPPVQSLQPLFGHSPTEALIDFMQSQLHTVGSGSFQIPLAQVFRKYKNSASPFEALKKIGEPFGVTTDYLLTEEPEPAEGENAGPLPVLRDRELLGIFEKVDQLAEEDRKLARDILEAVLARAEVRKLKSAF